MIAIGIQKKKVSRDNISDRVRVGEKKLPFAYTL